MDEVAVHTGGEDPWVGWAVSELGEGSALAREAATVLVERGGSATMLPDSFGTDPPTRHGLGRPTPWRELAERLRAEWPTCRIWVDLPLALPTDPGVDADPRLVVDGCQVYASIALAAPVDKVEEVLRAHDPSSLYAAVVTSDVATSEHPTRESSAGDVMAAVVAAHDGEAFVLMACRPGDSDG